MSDAQISQRFGGSRPVTPVEERIDHEKAKRDAERHLATLHIGSPNCRTCSLARAYLALLTEHSACEEELKATKKLAAEWEAWLDDALAALGVKTVFDIPKPATESAQPEEFNKGYATAVNDYLKKNPMGPAQPEQDAEQRVGLRARGGAHAGPPVGADHRAISALLYAAWRKSKARGAVNERFVAYMFCTGIVAGFFVGLFIGAWLL